MDALKRSDAWHAARRILAVRLDNMGDVLMMSPALRALRDAAPGRHIALLASGSGVGVAPFVPEIDETIEFAAPWMPGGLPTPESLQEMAARLHDGHFDAAVIFTTYSQSPLPAAMLCWLAGIPLRLAHCRENPYHLLTDWIPDPEPHEFLRHEVRRQLDLVATVGATAQDERLSFRIPPEDALRAIDKLRHAGIDPEEPWIVLHPGASVPSRRYPPEHFARVAELLAARPESQDPSGPQIVFTGNTAERELVDAIRAKVPATLASLAGELSLGELAAILAPAALLISNNTGPVHLAAALGTPVVDLYALTNPQHAPWMVPNKVLYHDVPCRFCYRSVCPQGHHDCLRLLDPERVARAARELLDHGAQRSSPPTVLQDAAAVSGG